MKLYYNNSVILYSIIENVYNKQKFVSKRVETIGGGM